MTILAEILQVKQQEVMELLGCPTPYKSTLSPLDKPSLFDTLYNAQFLIYMSAF